MRSKREYIHSSENYVQRFRGKGKVRDKPSAYILIVLSAYTVSNFEHARNCIEMVFRDGPSAFQKVSFDNTHNDSHILGMEWEIER